MTKLQFDNEWSQAVEKFNQSEGARFRRQRILAALDAKPGQSVLDVGSGPGHQILEISSVVGDRGHVCGVDPAEDGVKIARQRCSGTGNIEFQIGSVFDLPFENDTFDAAMSSQVFEYLDDVAGALREMYRVIRPGGRVLIHDTDWGSLLWHSTDAERMRRILTCWDGHLADPHLPQTMGAHLQTAGFQDIQVDSIVHIETSFEPDSMSDILMSFIVGYVSSQGIPAEEAEDWSEDLRSQNNYFYSSNEYIFTGVKP